MSLLIDIFRLFCCIPRDVSFSPLAAFVTHKKIERNSPKFLHPRVGYFIYLYIYFFFLSLSLFLFFFFFYSRLWKSKNASIARCAIAKGRLPPPATGRWRERGGGVGKKGHLPPPLNFFSSFNRFRPKKKRQKRELLLRAIVRKNLDEYFSFFQRGGGRRCFLSAS